jgi:enamine deaminase RidA (YjgF/YER057c/UK114 family)
MTAIARISSDSPYEDAIGYSRAVCAGPWVLVSGCTATVEGRVRHVGNAYQQARTAIEIALSALRQAGLDAADVVRTRMYVVDRAHAGDVGRAHQETFGAIRPAATMVVVAGLIDPQLLVEVEVDGYTEAGAR